jgi:hypothetical protein
LQYLLKYSNNQNNSENAKGIKGLWACFGPGAAAHSLVGWVCWAVAKKASQAPHIAQQGATHMDSAMAARCYNCSGEGTPRGGGSRDASALRFPGAKRVWQQRGEREASPSAHCGKGGEDFIGGKLGQHLAPRTSCARETI